MQYVITSSLIPLWFPTVEKYLPSGSVVMKDSKGTKFYLGKDSSYKVALNDEGIILPYVECK